jgi:tetratricopeptide (TPR) repeat protein
MPARSLKLIRTAIALASAVCFFTLPAVAAEPDIDWREVLQRCSDHEHPKPAILACTLILSNKDLPRDGQRDVYADRGLAYVFDHNYTAAIADYDKVIELADHKQYGYMLRATAYTAKGDFDNALADYNRAIAIDPRDPQAYNLRGDAYKQKGDLASAHGDFMTAGDIAAGDSPRSGSAIDYYDKATMADPHDAKAFNGAGRAWLDAYDDFGNAIPDFTSAIAIDPQYGEAYGNRCVARVFSGSDWPLAIADCNKAVELGQTKDARVLYARGVAKQKTGDITGEADIAVAKATQPDVDKIFARAAKK